MTRRLVAGYLVLALVVLVALEVPLGVLYARSERQAFDLRIERDATALAGLAEDALAAGGPYRRLRAAVSAYTRDTDARVVVVDASGRSVADTDEARPLGRPFASRPEFAEALAGRRAVGERGSVTLGGRIAFVAVPAVADGRVTGAVRVSVDADAVDARVRRYWLVLAGIGLVVLAAVAVVGRVVAGSVVRPLDRLGATARRIGEGDLSARADVSGPPEVRALAHRLNDSTARLEAVMAAQRDFVGDASHGLRTPLTALRLRLESLEREMGPAGRADLDAALAETDRLGALVEGLLALARADHPADRATVDVTAVCRERVEVWRPVAEEDDVTLTGRVDPGLVARAVPGALEQMLNNLVDNAVRAAPAGSEVEVSAAGDGAWVVVRVLDRGPGMDAAARRAALGRFWTTRPEGGGTGLGLAVVHRLTTASGGRVLLDARPGGGLVAEVRLPVS